MSIFLNPSYEDVVIATMKEAAQFHKKKCSLCQNGQSHRCKTGKSLKDEYKKILSLTGYNNLKKGV